MKPSQESHYEYAQDDFECDECPAEIETNDLYCIDGDTKLCCQCAAEWELFSDAESWADSVPYGSLHEHWPQ